MLPSRIHAVVPGRPRLQRADAAGAGVRPGHPPGHLTAVTVRVDPRGDRPAATEWAERDIPVPLIVLERPYRDITGPVLDYVARDPPRAARATWSCVFIPEYVVGHWWEHLLHNQSALRLKARLLFQPGVMVTSVPWQLRSSRRRPSTPRTGRRWDARQL